ncbi:MAG TPA: ATP synthase F0 subunit B [Candidatus Sulfotelmatobacter sp.]|nr:ATP synthase F0 subunit B [Candidatus Sulfotelmatobacter sp.]
MEILHQLAELFLEAVPTVVIVFLFYLFMRWAFFAPIQKAMAERSARIEGARAEAAAVEAAAKHDLDTYHEALKKARAEIYAQQDIERQAILNDRAKLLKAMRTRAQEEVDAAKMRIAAEVTAARAEMERSIPTLAGEIARAILDKPSQLPGGASR